LSWYIALLPSSRALESVLSKDADRGEHIGLRTTLALGL
jgi:hypothetical protein